MTNRNRSRFALAALALGLSALSDDSAAACLVKPREVDGLGTVYTFMLAPDREIAEYASLGFSRVQCPPDMSLFRQYAEHLCATTRRGSTPVFNTEALIGRPRERACASALTGLEEITRR